VNAQHSETIELGQVARTVTRGWRTVAAFTLAGMLAALAVVILARRQYTGAGSIILKVGTSTSSSAIVGQVTGLGDLTSGLLGGKSQMETEIEIMSSRSVAGELVDSLRLQARIFSDPMISPRHAVQSLSAPGSFKRFRIRFVSAGDNKTYLIKGGPQPGTMTLGSPVQIGPATLTFAPGARLGREFELEIRDRDDAIERLGKTLSINKGKGEVASISYRADDSVTAAAVPNLLMSTYLQRRRGVDRGVNQRNVEFLTAKADSMAKALTEATRSLRLQQEASGVLDAQAVAKVGLESSAELRAKLSDVLVEQGALQQLIAQVKAHTLGPRQLAAYPTFLKSPAVNDIISALTDVQTRRTILLGTRTAADPAVRALEISADSLEAQLYPYATTYASALAKERSDLESEIERIDASLTRLPMAAESGTRLQMRIEELARLSGGMQAQLVAAKLAAIGEGGDVRVLDHAAIPKRPSFPKPLMTLAGGTFGGFFCGLIAALLLGSLGRWVRDPMDVERTTGVPTLQFDPAVPLMLANGGSRTIIVAPIQDGVALGPVVRRLAQTAASRSITSAVLTLPATAPDVNGSINRLESEYELVIVQLTSLTSDSAAAALQAGRPVLLVTPGDRADRRRLLGAVQMLKRLEIPVAGIVMSSQNSLTTAAADVPALSV
jgi:uncharacterized protein involved in exopolysaccharide biosynthesis